MDDDIVACLLVLHNLLPRPGVFRSFSRKLLGRNEILTNFGYRNGHFVSLEVDERWTAPLPSGISHFSRET